jgi:NAD(P)-dependent dehydrogenase (short-subunit alcohol dehydrogenase family)
VIITGGNSGLGFACAQSLLSDISAAYPWHVVLACRDPARAQAAVARLSEKAIGIGSAARVEALRLDLASLQSVREFAVEIRRRLDLGEMPALHAVVCNAGVQSGGKQTSTADGFESTFGVNHLGHFLLVNLMLPVLLPPARVIIVSSGTHDPAQKTRVPAPAWNDPAALARGELGPAAAADKPFARGQRLYSTSKLANIYFTCELARRLPAGVTANGFDPGLMPGTGLIREAPAPIRFIGNYILPRTIPLFRRLLFANIHTVEESGAALARLVTDPALADTTGKYFEGLREIRSSDESYDAGRGAELWNASTKLTGPA